MDANYIQADDRRYPDPMSGGHPMNFDDEIDGEDEDEDEEDDYEDDEGGLEDDEYEEGN